MATPAILDVELLLRPVAGPDPSGESLAYEAEYDLIREARRSEDDAPQGDWQRRAKAADWDRVIDLGSTCLCDRSKDLQIAAWITEALVRLHGFAGLRDGLRLIHGLLDRYWETFHPRIEDGDLESRAGPFLFLNDVRILPRLIRSIPLTDGFGGARYTQIRWQESRATHNAGLKNPGLMEAMIAEGKITSQQFDDAVAQTPRSFYETLVADLREARDAYEALDRLTDERFGRDAPSLLNIREALDDCRKLLEPILARKREDQPDEADEPAVLQPEAEPQPGTTDDESTADPAFAARARPAAPRRGTGAAAPMADAQDAYRRVLEAAAYLRQNEPNSPVPYLLVRSLRLGELYGMSRPPDPSELPGPPREVRQALRHLAAEGRWDELVEQVEQALGRPEGRAWLDAHRLGIVALEQAGRDVPAAAIRSLLRAVLAEFPGLPQSELDDGTRAAGSETEAWLEAEFTPPPPVPPHRAEMTFETPRSAGADPGAETEQARTEGAVLDPWTLAMEDVEAGRTGQAIARLRQALAAAPTGREKFRRKLQLAELCLEVQQAQAALPLLDDLARQVDEFRLEQWEDEALCAQVWGTLYRCLRASGADNGHPERAREVYARLCRLDIHQALLFGHTNST